MNGRIKRDIGTSHFVNSIALKDRGEFLKIEKEYCRLRERITYRNSFIHSPLI